MTRSALIEREKKRARLVEKYKAKRLELLAIIRNNSTSFEEKFAARLRLQSIPRNAAPVRQRNRCAITGRPRGFVRKFGLARNKLRELVSNGQIPGMVKSSW